MQSYNKLEYEQICKQVGEASSAVMRYSSTAVAISGTVLLIIVSNKAGNVPVFTASFCLLLLSALTQMIHSLVLYKCDSHNRLAAYRHIISCEVINTENGAPYTTSNDEQLVGFDFCISSLNRVYATRTLKLSWLQDAEFATEGIFKQFSEDKSEIYQWIASGFPEITIVGTDPDQIITTTNADVDINDHLFPYISDFFGKILSRSGSWGFPSFVNRVVFSISLAEIIISFILFGDGLISTNHTLEMLMYIILYTSVLCIMIWFNIKILKQNLRFYRQIIVGSRRISSYLIQFLPFRLIYINGKLGRFPPIKPYYIGGDWSYD